jgi:hypothetical protein
MLRLTMEGLMICLFCLNEPLFSCYLLLLVEEGGRTSCGIGVDLMAFSTQQQ